MKLLSVRTQLAFLFIFMYTGIYSISDHCWHLYSIRMTW